MSTKRNNSSKKRISIATRLYFVVGIMGLLIVLELITLRFAMGKLSAVRAFVGGESLWSKAQKNAVFSLQRYASTRDEFDYQMFRQFLSIPEGDHIARIELKKPNPDLEVVRKGFLQGKIHQDDIDPMIDLLLRFYWVTHLDRAIQAWVAADGALAELIDAGEKYHAAVLKKDEKGAAALMNRVKDLNERLTELEENFSSALGEGSRFLESIVLTILTIAVIMVESIGLGLAVITARSISRGLNSLNLAAQNIGKGRFDISNLPRSNDEIGELAVAVEKMGGLLKKSYGELEARVQERTAELAKLAAENANLYDNASRSLERRDEFLSLASHELKTPITSMLLQAQMMIQNEERRSTAEQVKKFSVFLERQLLRINDLVEEMLDTSRIDLSKLALRLEKIDLSELIREVCQRLRPQFEQAQMELTLNIQSKIRGSFDSYRVEQVITNLLTNTLKYAQGKPVTVELKKEENFAVLSVADRGPGVAPEDQERIFGRFERGVDPGRISGLGIGLYITKAIVKAHNGTISLRSQPNGGANFVVELPLKV